LVNAKLEQCSFCLLLVLPSAAFCSNDAFDAETGVDQTKPESVVNLTGNRTAVLLLSKAFLAAGLLLLGWGISSAGDSRISAMLGIAIVCGYVYQGPPFRYEGLSLLVKRRVGAGHVEKEEGVWSGTGSSVVALSFGI
jgi:1,4-dihydroxy-2-naphthoate octaprenyltransferase